MIRKPAGTEIPIEQEFHLRLDPCGDMNTVSYIIDRDLLLGKLWPQAPPHATGYFPVAFADPIVISGHPEGKGGHIKARIRCIRVDPELEKGIVIHFQGRPVVAKIFFH